MKNRIEIYSAIKSFYESGNNLIEVYGSLILKLLNDNKYSINSVKAILTSESGIDVPIDALHTIIKRCKKNGYIEYENLKDNDLKTISLTEQGKAEKQQIIECFGKAEREKNGLIKNISSYIYGKNKKTYSEQQIENNLNIFIEQNLNIALEALDGKQKDFGPMDSDLQFLIAEYFKFTEKNDEGSFNILKSFLYGKVISSTFLLKNFEKDAKFSKLNIYLDTNMVFSLFEFHEDFFNKPAKELMEIIKSLKINLKIFSFTKDEIVAKLRGYLISYNDYYSEIRVDTIYHVLKRKNYSEFDILNFIENLEDKLANLGVEIDYRYEIEDLLKDNSELLRKMSNVKPSSPIPSIQHDTCAILAIKKLRGKLIPHILEKSKNVFLTADHILASFDYSSCNHGENYTFPEVIYRNELTSILWLKKQPGSDNIFIENFFSNFARKELISRSLWEKFTRELKNQKEKGSITEEDIHNIMSFGEVGKILKEKGENGIGEIINEDKINKRKEETRSKEEEIRQSKKFIELQKNEIADKDKKIEEGRKLIEDQSDKLDKILQTIKNKGKKRSNMVINCILWIIAGLILYLWIFISLIMEISIWWPYSWFINLVTIIIIIKILEARYERELNIPYLTQFTIQNLNLIDSRRKIENWLVQQYINKKRKELSIN